MKIYLTKPMKGHSYEEVVGYYDEVQPILESQGWTVLNPMTGKSYLKGEKSFKGHNYTQSLSSDHAIFVRDRWMVRQADALLVNLLNTKDVSIGTMFEMAWASDEKHVVTIMDKDNIHWHAFVLQASHVVYETLGEALDYLAKLAKGEV